MAWLDELRPASFRGVPFEVDTAQLTVGRRQARHEYPQRNLPYIEDQGRKAREYRVEAFVVGPDYIAARDALIDALEAEGAAQLVHPYYGTQRVSVLGDCQITESTQHGGLAKILILFIEAGKQDAPSTTVDTASVVAAQHDASEEAFGEEFANRFSVDGLPDFAIADALESMNTALAMPGMALSNVASLRANPLNAQYALLPENLLGSMSNPLSLARGFMSLVRGVGDVLSLFDFYRAPVGTSILTASRIAQNNNRVAFNGLIAQAATAQRIVDLTQSTPAAIEDVRAARSEVLARADAVLMDPTTGDLAADALIQLRTDAVNHFAAIAPSLPRLTRITNQVVLPALVIAHDFYGDPWYAAERDSEVVQRNRVRHPGFVPAGQPLVLVV